MGKKAGIKVTEAKRRRGPLARALAAVRLISRRRRDAKRDYELVATSGLFDPDYYVRHNRDLGSRHRDLLKHYLERGWREGRNPGPQFDTGWYVDRYADVRKAAINPLLHYIRYGLSEGRFPRKPDLEPSATSVLGPYESWLAVNALSSRDIAELRARLGKRMDRLPRISVVMPVFNSDLRLLEEAVSSVENQIYDHWELCLIDDGSSAADLPPLLERLATSNSRIRVMRLQSNSGISVAANAAVDMANGDVLVFLDHDDLLSRDCLAELAIYYADHPDADIVYSDDDKIDPTGWRYAPQFKPDWSPTLLLSWMYVGHVFSVRAELFRSIGGFRSQFDGCQDYDFALRAAEAARHVGHIPKVLYHWRAVEGSTATGSGAKPKSIERGLQAVQDAVQRRSIHGANAFHPPWASERDAGYFDLHFPDEGASVTIIVHAADGASRLRECLAALAKTSYRNYEVLVIASDDEQAEAVEEIGGGPPARLVRIGSNGTFTGAEARSEAVRHCSSEYLLFLDSEAEVTNASWLSQMVGYGSFDNVAAVGARICSEDGNLLHAGLVHGYADGLMGPAFAGLPSHDPGYLALAWTSRECSGVKGSCLLTRRDVFERLGGFDGRHFPEVYFDADYCLRALKSGLTCIYCASAEVRVRRPSCHSGKSFEESAQFRRLHENSRDRWYNPNLSLDNERFDIDAVRPETTTDAPVRLVIATHNLNNEGAPGTLLELVVGLAARKLVDPYVVSPSDGPLRREYEKQGIGVFILDHLLRGVYDRHTQAVAFDGLGMLFKALGAEVVLANTLHTYWAVKGAKMGGVPSIWAQHESEPWETYFDYLPQTLRAAAYEAFSDAYRVIYVAEATRRAWSPVETRRNFKLIRHAIPPEKLALETARWSRERAREQLGVAPDSYLLSVVGAVCRRKGQRDLAEAFLALPADLRSKTHVYIVGAIAEPDYAAELKNLAAGSSRVLLTGHVEDPFLYYAASDVSICTSRIESAPRVLLEAMACALPIITTPVFGIPEIVEESVNALFYDPGNTSGLATAIERLLRDEALRSELACNSQKVLAGQPGFSRMVELYGSVIRQAVNLKLSD